MGVKRIRSFFERKIKKGRDFFRLYTTGMSRSEIERLLHKDTLEALTYYKEKTTLDDGALEKKSLKSKIGAFKEMFMSFLMPAGRNFFNLFMIFSDSSIYTGIVHFSVRIGSE